MPSSPRVVEVPLRLEGVAANARFVCPASEPLGKVAFFHGRGGSHTRHLPAALDLAGRGIASLVFDFRGCGETPSPPSVLSGWIEDAADAMSFLIGADPIAAPCGIYGSSFGGCLAALMTKRFTIGALTLRAPAAYPPEFWSLPPAAVDDHRSEIWAYRCGRGVGDDVAVQALGEYQGSVLIVGGNRDEEVPANLLRAYERSATVARRRRLEIIVGADHTMGEPSHADAFRTLMSEWFTTELVDQSGSGDQ